MVFANESCSSQVKPPLRVRSIVPSPPTAHPVFLSAANFTLLIVFPCGSGFCHCHDLVFRPCPEAEKVAIAKKRTMTRHGSRRERSGRLTIVNVENNIFARSDSPIQDFRGVRRFLEATNYKDDGRGKLICLKITRTQLFYQRPVKTPVYSPLTRSEAQTSNH